MCKRFSTKSRNDANMDGTVRLTSLVYLAPSSLGRYARRGVNAAPKTGDGVVSWFGFALREALNMLFDSANNSTAHVIRP